MTIAEIKLWGKTIGAVSWNTKTQLGHFEYDPAFRNSGIEIAPLTMPLSDQIYSFPALSRETFHGLPGLLADSLPDDYGNALIAAWLVREGRDPGNFNPVERLCYTGDRGMGALEYYPREGPHAAESEQIDLEALVDLASEILTKRSQLEGSFEAPKRQESLQKILRVGTSAGGARAKAIIAWNPKTQEVRSGQIETEKGFQYWLLKFDGVSGNKDKELEDAAGYGLIEYAYYNMALAAGIQMKESRVLRENGRNHFMTRRFDRTESGRKVHMQSFCAMEHFDFKQAGAHSYEQALRTIRKLGMPMESLEEQFRRMAFNIMARNQDDHVKNISYLMDQSGQWALSPAFDMTYSYNPHGNWTSEHQMSLNGKRSGFTREDFKACARNASIQRGRAEDLLQQVRTAVSKWEEFADSAGVSEEIAYQVGANHRLGFSEK